MIIYHTATQQAYDELMIELEETGHRWLSGNSPTFFNYWGRSKEDSCIIISSKYITFMNIEQSKKQHSNTPIIEYKAKGENMTQEEMKQKLHENALDVFVKVQPFYKSTSESESDLKEAKSSAKKLIEKIDEYLESQKPKFKVGDYVTVYVNGKEKIAKIDELMVNDIEVRGLWYDRTLVNIKQDYWFSSGLNKFRHARPTEIAEYKVALTFHKHGRNPFEVKEGDIIRDDEGKILKDDEVKILSTFPKNLKKNRFTSGRYTFLKTTEEYNEWLENK